MPFHLYETMELNNLNARKEGQQDSKRVVVDLKFVGAVSIKELLPLVGVASAEELEASLWDPEDEYNVRLANLGSIAVHGDTEFEHLHCHAFGTRMIECTAHKFSFKPHAGGAQLTFTLTVPDPSENILPMAAEQLGNDVSLEIAPAQQGLALGDALE